MTAPRDHTVLFYDRETELATAVAHHVARGLAAGRPAVVVATPAHRAQIEESLAGQGIDVAAAAAQGRYQSLDAATTLATFMVGGRPDAVRFRARVGGLLAVAAGSEPAQVFGELVALLWDGGDPASALAVEGLWNLLADERRFSLLCGYPTGALNGHGELTSVVGVCQLHSSWAAPDYLGSGPAPHATPAGVTSHVFLPVPAAVAAVRRFVASCLTAPDDEGILADAALVASELATNAVRHAASPFRVGVVRRGRAVRITVEDVGAADPARRPGPDGLGGRGVPIVADVSERWGHERRAAVKVVWADLEPR